VASSTYRIKNGTNQFHGSAYYFWRHEQFNANEWFNNKTICRNRFIDTRTQAAPLVVRSSFPALDSTGSRTKLFFFLFVGVSAHHGNDARELLQLANASGANW